MAFSNEIKRRIITDNLRTQERDMTTALEARRSHLSDLASVLLLPHRMHPVTPEVLRRIGEDALLTSGEVGLHREVRPDTRADLLHTMTGVLAYDRAVLAQLLLSRLAREGIPLTPESFLPPIKRPARIAYVRHAYTEEAFDAFASLMDQPTARFTDSYEDACREMTEGDAGYCILPWRDTNGAYHRATLLLLEAFDLVTVSTVTVTDGEDVPMQYALVTRSAVSVRGAWELLLTLPPEWCARLEELTATPAHFDITLHDLAITPDRGHVLLTLRGTGTVTSFFIWLCLFAPTYHIRGFYPQTEEMFS